MSDTPYRSSEAPANTTATAPSPEDRITEALRAARAAMKREREATTHTGSCFGTGSAELGPIIASLACASLQAEATLEAARLRNEQTDRADALEVALRLTEQHVVVWKDDAESARQDIELLEQAMERVVRDHAVTERLSDAVRDVRKAFLVVRTRQDSNYEASHKLLVRTRGEYRSMPEESRHLFDAGAREIEELVRARLRR